VEISMTEKEKIDAAVAKALAEASKESDAAIEKAREEERQKNADAIEEAKQLAQVDADAERQKEIDEAVANAKAEATRDADARIEAILTEANSAIDEARQSGIDSAARGGRTGELKHYVTIGVSFIGGSLLAVGSRVTSDDLGTYRDPSSGVERQVKPGETLVEVNADGTPVDATAAWRLQSVAGNLSDMPIAAVQPFAPNPTAPQGAPAQPPGGVSLVEGHLRTSPPQGVESDEAAQARADQAGRSADSVAAMTAGEAPRRRGASG
jgi:hypothetical protein